MKPPTPEALELAFALLTGKATVQVVSDEARAPEYTAIVSFHLEGIGSRSVRARPYPMIIVYETALPQTWQLGDRAIYFELDDQWAAERAEDIGDGFTVKAAYRVERPMTVNGLLTMMKGSDDGGVAFTLEEAWRVVVALLQPVARGMREMASETAAETTATGPRPGEQRWVETEDEDDVSIAAGALRQNLENLDQRQMRERQRLRCARCRGTGREIVGAREVGCSACRGTGSAGL